jgi:hypothetical protein
MKGSEMIHGIYLRTKPKHKWHLFSTTASAEAASKELVVAMEIAQKGGNDQGQAAIQVFDSRLFIPELLNEIKEQKPLGFN